MSQPVIEGIKLIRHTGAPPVDDDPSYPFKLDVNLSAPEGGGIGWILLYGGSEELVVRGMTVDALHAFVAENELRTHPRLRRLVITGPDGEIERVDHGGR